jgi:hypothetical protein
VIRARAAVVGLLLIPIASPASAQSGAPSPRLWLALGLGFGGDSNVSSQGAGLAEVAYQRGPHQLTLRAAGIVDPFGSHANIAGDVGLLYGVSRAGSFGHASLSAGLSVVGFDRCESSQDGCVTAGLPLDGELALRLAPVLGLGLQAFTNINSESMYWGAVVFVQMGSLP